MAPPLNQTMAARQAAARAALAEKTGIVAVTAQQKAAQKQVDDAKAARVATGLRSLAIAAEALRRIPGGGALADGLLKALDASVNKGGKLYQDDKGQLRRTKPPATVGWAFLLSIAPWAMRAIGPAVQAARVGLGRFGPALVRNLGTAASFVGGKAKALLSKAAALPGVSKVAGLAKKALTAASIALGFSAVLPQTRAKVDAVATKAVAKVARGGNKVVDAVTAVPEAALDVAKKGGDWLKWGALAAGGLLLLKTFG